MKSFLVKQENLAILIPFIIILAFMVFQNLSAEKVKLKEFKELEMIMNMNNDTILETYNFDMSKREGEIGTIKIEYVELEQGSASGGKSEIAEIYLPDATKAYTINTVIQLNEEPKQSCVFTMDYPDYEIIVVVHGSTTVSIFPSGEVRLSSDVDSWRIVSYKRKNKDFMLFSEILFSFHYACDFKILPYRNGLIIEADSFDWMSMHVENEERLYRTPYYLRIDKYVDHEDKIKYVWVTRDKTGEPVALVDTNNDGDFDTNIAEVSWMTD